MKYCMAIIAALLVAAISAAGVSVAGSDPAVAAGGQAKKCGGGTIALNAKELAAFKKHNSIRKNRGLSQLCVHPALQKAARKHSRDMIDRQYFSHDTKGSGRTFAQRIKAAGYKNYTAAGENIACGQNPTQVMNNWMNSSGHRANILSGKYREIGIGVVTGEIRGWCSGSGTAAYTADFGAR